MPKLKTHKGAAKRVRLTATGKIKRGHSHARHILTKKTNKRKRHLDIDVLVSKSLAALEQTDLTQLVVAGGVGANRVLRRDLSERAQRIGAMVYYPDLQFCTDNGAMIAFAGAQS